VSPLFIKLKKLRQSQAISLFAVGPFANNQLNAICGPEDDSQSRTTEVVSSPSEDSLSYRFDWSVEMMEELDIAGKNCPICSLQLPLSEFGVCRARKDGRNLYCKSCIRKKVTESRRALKEYRSSRKRFVSQPQTEHSGTSQLACDQASSVSYTRLLSKLSPAERVREAIRKGARTQREIAQETRLGKDEIGDALANLLLWTREIKTQIVDNTRLYFINESAELPIREDALDIPRKGDLPSSFSALQGLMPGRNPEGEEPEKIGGWVAA
jgi:hypothetical protein